MSIMDACNLNENWVLQISHLVDQSINLDSHQIEMYSFNGSKIPYIRAHEIHAKAPTRDIWESVCFRVSAVFAVECIKSRVELFPCFLGIGGYVGIPETELDFSVTNTLGNRGREIVAEQLELLEGSREFDRISSGHIDRSDVGGEGELKLQPDL